MDGPLWMFVAAYDDNVLLLLFFHCVLLYQYFLQASLPSSQISSWSMENDIHQNTLEDINSVLKIIGRGRISPIKYQIRKDVDDLKPRTLRSLKRKVTQLLYPCKQSTQYICFCMSGCLYIHIKSCKHFGSTIFPRILEN